MTSDFAEVLHRVATLHDKIANDICPNGEAGRLVCRECGEVLAITPQDVSQYLRRGWPRCCEKTMYWNQEQTT